jgi:general secretion pathway protein D
MKRQLRSVAFFLASMAVGAVSPSWSRAQVVPSTSDIPSTEPSAGVAASSGQLVSSPTTQPVAKLISFNFKNASVGAVIDYLSQNAGFFVIEQAVPTGQVTIINREPITPEEAVKYLNTVLQHEDLTAIQMGKVLKIEALADAKHANIPVLFGDDPTKVEETDQLITQIIPVRNVDAVKLKTDLQPLVNTNADLTANAASNSLLITDTSANVRRVVEIVSGLDKHESAANDIRVKQLKYADATAAAKLIMDIFNPQTNQTNGAQNGPFGNLPFFRFGGGGGGPGGGGFGAGGPGGGGRFGGGGGGPGGGAAAAAQQDTGNTGHVQASADDRTNTVVVSGPPDTLAIIDGVLSQLDANPASEQDFFIYRVKNGVAVDMASTLNGLFSGTTASSSTAQRSTFSSGTGNRISGSGGFGSSSGLGGGGGFGGGGGLGGGGLGGSGFGGTNRSTGTTSGTTGLAGRSSAAGGVGVAGLTGSAANAGGVSELIGQVYVVADQDTNSLLIATATKYKQQVLSVIDKLDSRVPQVLIKVLIAEVTHDNELDFGTDFSILDTNRNYAGKEQLFQSTLGAAAAAASVSNPGGLAVTLLEGNITAKLQALAQQNKLDVLSRPYILTSDNQEADITVGSEVPFITSTEVDTNGGVHNNAQYQDIGIILTVTPHINPEGMVTMLVSPQVSSLTAQTVTIQQGVALPVFDVRSADSYLTVRDGQTIVIGGMMQDQKTESVNKIPLLGDIPLLGKLLFSYNTMSKTKTELLIFLTPHVAAEPDTLKPMGEDEMKGLKLVPGAVQPGVFQEHMSGMQRGNASTQPTPSYVPPAPPSRLELLEPPDPGKN